MLYTISNEYLAVGVESRGAELQSVSRAGDGLEYLWQGNPEFWEARAPLLFPLIGRLKGGSYALGGRSYSMGIHGFAKDSEFRASKTGDDTLSFFLRDSVSTIAAWPFSFELEVRFTLAKRCLRKDHILRNRGGRELLYEVGGHEGYNVALFPGEGMADYYLQFEGLDSISSPLLDRDLMITRETRTIALEGGRLALDMPLFDGDALILETAGERRVVLANSLNEERIRVSFPDFPFLGIWTRSGRKETKYVCIEPWSSLPDCTFLDDKLEHKVGIRRLAGGESEKLGYTMEFGGF